MELISRITLRRCEMGEGGGDAQRHGGGRLLVVFRVLGKSPERAMKVFNAEKAKDPDPVMVVSLSGKTLSEGEREICAAVMEHGIRQSTKIVFCGGDPGQIFGGLAVDGKAMRWFPSIPSFISTYEIDGGRQSAGNA